MASKATNHQTAVRRAMEGNVSAYFHPFEERIAFLQTDGRIIEHDSRTFEETGRSWVVPTEGSVVDVILRADVKMAYSGFDRPGRIEEAYF